MRGYDAWLLSGEPGQQDADEWADFYGCPEERCMFEGSGAQMQAHIATGEHEFSPDEF